MVFAGKARRFAQEDDFFTQNRRRGETFWALSQGNDSQVGAQQFSAQEGFTPITQSGLQDTTKVLVGGSQWSGGMGAVLRICELDTATNTLDITKDASGNIYPQVPGDVIVVLDAGVTANLEFIEFPKFGGHKLRLFGTQGNTTTVIHTGGATANAIKCPSDANFTWNDDEVLDFVFNVVSGQWHLMTGAGPAGGGGAFANQTLSNLTVGLVAVNTDLNPGVDNLHDLGTGALRWNDLNYGGLLIGGGASFGANVDFNGFYADFDAIAVPLAPAVGTRRLFSDTTNNDELSIRRSDGTVVSLEAGAGAGFANQALSNLVGVSINADLIPQANLDLGSTGSPWDELHVGQIDFDTTGTKDGTKHQVYRDTPNNNLVFNVPIAEEFEWCENGIPRMNLNLASLSLTGTGASLTMSGIGGTFMEFVNTTSPGINTDQTGLVQYEGFNSISLQRIFAETEGTIVSNISGQEIGNYLIETTSRGIQGGLTYEQNDDTFSFTNFGITTLHPLIDIDNRPVAPPGFALDSQLRFRGLNSASTVTTWVEFEIFADTRTAGIEEGGFDIRVQENSGIFSYVEVNRSGSNKIVFNRDIDINDNALILDGDADSRFISPIDDFLNLELGGNIEYTWSPGAFLVGNVTGSYIQMREMAQPATPGANRAFIFLDNSGPVGELKIIHDDSSVISLESGGGGSQTPWLTNINADSNDLNNLANLNLLDTGGFGDGRITFDANEDSDTWIGNDNVIDQVRFVANAIVQARYNASGWIFDNNVNLTGNYMDITGIAVPADPAGGVRRLFVNSATQELSVRTSAGTTISLEQGGAGGGADTDLGNLVPTQINQALIADVDSVRDLGSNAIRWRSGWIDDLTVTNSILASSISSTTSFTSLGSVTTLSTSTTNINSSSINLGNSSADNIDINGRIDTNVIPDNNEQFDLGSPSLRWAEIWAEDGEFSGDMDVDGDVTIGDDLEINGDLNHDGPRIGFFGTSPVTKQTVFDLPGTASLLQVIGAYNNLIFQLEDYGLLQVL